MLLFALVARGAAAVDFNRDIAPILARRCLECHSATEQAGGLVLTHAEALLDGGDSGVVLVPGEPLASHIIQRVVAGEMPPLRQGRSQRLPDVEIERLTDWVKTGATWPQDRILDFYEATNDVRAGRDWWSLQPVTRPVLPVVNIRDNHPWNTGRGITPIDAFVLRELQSNGMEPAPRGSRPVLIRRAFYELIGLPPTAQQIDAFVNDPADDAWERVVEDLLASPHYGERWARHWLDLVRYADTSGYERDQPKPFAWKYRDWVVRAFNADKARDRFIIEQLAGDELPDRTDETVIATGFLRLGTWNDEPNDPQDYAYDRLEDLVHVTSSAFLGLTVKCARCHDHKFDPIPQVDYYRMAAAFWPGPLQARDRALLGGPSDAELGTKDILGWTDLTNEPVGLHLLKAGNRHQPQQIVAPASLSFASQLFREFDSSAEGMPTTTRRLQLARWMTSPENPLTARVMVNRVWQHHFGEGLVRSPNNFGFHGDPPTHPELLDWLASDFVAHNWKMKPLHRAILMSHSWQQSSLHPAYDEYSQRDYGNRLLWRANRRRLDAESLRDTLLAASGELDLRVGGPGFTPTLSAGALEGLSRKSAAWTASPTEEQVRRSLYIFSRRSLLTPLLTTFNFSETTLPCGQRDVTTVAPQALALLNSEFSHARSSAMAQRVIRLAGDNPQVQVREAWRLSLGRTPTAAERELAITHLRRQTDLSRVNDSKSAVGRESVEATSRDAGDQVLPARRNLVLHLRADRGIQQDVDGRLLKWDDQSGQGHHAFQQLARQQPAVVSAAFSDSQRENLHVAGRRHAAVRFDAGQQQFLHLTDLLLSAESSTMFAVVIDRGSAGHREIISNWNGSVGNSGSSVFLGLTGEKTVRFSDSFSSAGEITDRDKPFLLTAINGPEEVRVFQNTVQIASKSGPLGGRRLDTAWVIGQQGNINGEYWNGDIAEVIVFDRALSDGERDQVWNQLRQRYGLSANNGTAAPPSDALQTVSASQRALASLCHVLLNSNELLYID